jgi:UDP-glucose 4-epimerase
MSGIELIRGDACDPSGLPDRYDWLVHCAAEVPATMPSPDALYRANMEASRAIFHHAVAAGANGIVNLSSMAAFGDIGVLVVDEATPVHEPGAYGRSKLDAEKILCELAAEHGLCTASIRLPGVVGLGSRNNFLSDIGPKIARGETVRAVNPDAWFNNILHVRDLSAFIETLIGRLEPGHKVLTIAATDAMRIRDVLSRLFQLCGQVERIEFASATRAAFTIAFSEALALGYQPRTVSASLDAFGADLAQRPA